MVSKELSYGKDGPQCRQYGFSCVEWCRSVTPRRGKSWMGQDVGLVARARSRSSLCKSSSVSLVDLVLAYEYMLLLKNC